MKALPELTPELLAFVTPEEQAELDEILGDSVPEGIVDRTHPRQAAFVEDQSRFICVMCTRRAGKSTGLLRRFLVDAYQNPGCNYLYAGLTLDSAKKAIWKDGFKDIDVKLGLGLKFNEVASTITLPNGSIIYVIGMDSSDQQKRKARGGKYRGVAVDEAQDFASDLDDLIVSVMKPAVSDQQGWIVLAGTPGQVPTGLFYRISAMQCAERAGTWVTRDVDTATEWRGHTWSAYDNPYMAQQTRADIEEQERINPGVRDTPKFQREWRGMWVTDDDRRVYRYDPKRNDFDGKLPKYATGQWYYAMGVDLGFNDDTAVVVLAWHDHDRCVYVLDCDKRPGLDITATAQWIRSWANQYDSPYIVVDGANKQAVEEIRRRHNLALITADKRGKDDFTDLMNASFLSGTIKLSPQCEMLKEEYAHLSWDERAWKRGRRIEDPRASNHACFVAGTMVATEHGERPIETIRPGDMVWTRKGLRPVQNAGSTGIRDVVSATIAGRTLTGTPDHPVWTDDAGWVRLDSFPYAVSVPVWANEATSGSKPSSTADSRGGGIQIRHGGPSASTSSVSRRDESARRLADDCIAPSGPTQTDPFRPSITSTTSTATPSTTGSKILNALLLAITCPDTWTRSAAPRRGSAFARRLQPRRSGMRRLKDLHGTLRMGAASWPRDPFATASAASAGPRSGASGSRRAFAVPTAQQSSAETADSTTLTVVVLDADGRSASTNTRTSKHALGPAVRTPDMRAVYNLTVDDQHEYFANGVLVSNCDAAAYSWRFAFAYMAEGIKDKVAHGSKEWADQQEAAMLERTVASIRDKEEGEFEWLT